MRALILALTALVATGLPTAVHPGGVQAQELRKATLAVTGMT